MGIFPLLNLSSTTEWTTKEKNVNNRQQLRTIYNRIISISNGQRLHLRSDPVSFTGQSRSKLQVLGELVLFGSTTLRCLGHGNLKIQVISFLLVSPDLHGKALGSKNPLKKLIFKIRPTEVLCVQSVQPLCPPMPSPGVLNRSRTGSACGAAPRFRTQAGCHLISFLNTT